MTGNEASDVESLDIVMSRIVIEHVIDAAGDCAVVVEINDDKDGTQAPDHVTALGLLSFAQSFMYSKLARQFYDSEDS